MGWLAGLMAEQVPEGRVVGMDVSDEMIRRARRRHVDVENAMFVVGEADQIPWDANFFTHVISVESAYYWPDPAAGLREIFRVMREGGSVWVLINYYREIRTPTSGAKFRDVPRTCCQAENGRLVSRSGLRRR